jgi:hypothetical protein
MQPTRDCHFPSFKSASKASVTDDDFGRFSSKRVRFESSRQKRSSSLAPSLHIREHNDVNTNSFNRFQQRNYDNQKNRMNISGDFQQRSRNILFVLFFKSILKNVDFIFIK